MQDNFKAFVISLVTSVAVLFVLGPVMMKLQGKVGPADAPAPAAHATTPAAPAAATAITAPNLEGMTVREARDRWREQGIIIIEDGERAESSVKAGAILEQNPSAGAPLKQKEIRVTVASAPELVQVPNVVGEAVASARQSLVEAGFEVPPEEFEDSEEAEGSVLRQEPNPGAQTEAGSIIRLVVAQKGSVAVPKVRGKSLGAAKKAITGAGLVVGSISHREHEELSGGRVLGSTPDAGEKVAPGSTVDLLVVAPD